MESTEWINFTLASVNNNKIALFSAEILTFTLFHLYNAQLFKTGKSDEYSPSKFKFALILHWLPLANITLHNIQDR